MTKEMLSKRLALTLPSSEHRLDIDWPAATNLDIVVKRDDLIHPFISGNKWRKLQHQLQHFFTTPPARVISFGGGFSNHLHALAYCCHQLAIPFTAIVRGNYQLNPSPMLRDLRQWHTDIQYVDKHLYQQRAEPGYLAKLHQRYQDSVIIPEGGSQTSALAGFQELLAELQQNYDYILAPVASGGTLAGIIAALAPHHHTQVLGIAALKGEGYLENLVAALLPETHKKSASNWHIIHDFHFGGYAKSTAELRAFCQTFTAQHGVAIEPVYSGKVFFALRALLAAGYFTNNSKILVLHTGGLQGARNAVS
ncbi:MAG: pyridoxal-phosphate dependent enzyme [Paraglaciecola sp.]|nr:pyridoxal-phosphate dependent enzyme [Paraglaciecola sp.]NCT46826.1 pyridoxal-phosphate dependent enzyme [Paraglaciecola sp.]